MVKLKFRDEIDEAYDGCLANIQTCNFSIYVYNLCGNSFLPEETFLCKVMRKDSGNLSQILTNA